MIKGLDALRGLVKNLADLASIPSQSASEVAKGIKPLIEEEFDKGRDPYGRGWQRLSPRTVAMGRGWPPLTDTGAMRASLEVKPSSGAGISISIDEPIQFHQYGTSRMPARPVLPTKETPASWVSVIQTAYDNAMARRLK